MPPLNYKTIFILTTFFQTEQTQDLCEEVLKFCFIKTADIKFICKKQMKGLVKNLYK